MANVCYFRGNEDLSYHNKAARKAAKWKLSGIKKHLTKGNIGKETLSDEEQKFRKRRSYRGTEYFVADRKVGTEM
jgi:hypothetical protein